MSAPHRRTSGIDPVRKLGIVGLLIGGMLLLYRFAIPSGEIDPTGLLALGFVVLAGYTIGELVGVVKLPHITGYLVGGMLLGPSVAHSLPESWQIGPFVDGILNQDVIEQLSLLDTLALALIALTAGGELKIESLRKGVGTIMSVLSGQVVAILAVTTLFVYALSGVVPFISLPGLDSVTTTQALALGALVGVISIATSPAATIAVINGAQASGPYTNTVLSAVVLKDVVVVLLFSVVSALAGTVLGVSSVGENLVGFLLVHILGSLALGAVLGLGIDLYLRYVSAEILLFVVGLVYTATFLAYQLHLDPILLFIAAGFAASNFSEEGDRLVHEVERLSMPVYVVFFTLAGAKLHLDSLLEMAPFAITLFVLRAAAIWAGVRAGATVAGAPRSLREYGWMGFISQAGVALGLASLVGDTYGAAGQSLNVLIIAGIALNELFGPVLFKVGLGLAQELPEDDEFDEDTATAELPRDLTDEGILKPWEPPEGVADPWGDPPGTSSATLERIASDIELELQSLIRELLEGPLARFQHASAVYLRALRREFLRHHRRIAVRVERTEIETDPASELRTQQAELASRWRGIVLDRSARLTGETWSPAKLTELLDATVEGLPLEVNAAHEPATLRGAADESPLASVQRAWLRLRHRWNLALGRRLPTRVIQLRALARYHYSGAAPERLEGLAALLVNAESHLAARTRSLFDGIIESYDRVAADSDRLSSGAGHDIGSSLRAVRVDVDEEFALANQEIDSIVREAALRAARALSQPHRDFKADLAVIGTLDLPTRRRRYSRIYARRTKALQVLDRGLIEAREGNASTYVLVALEFELVGLEARIKQAVELHGAQLSRVIEGRGHTQLQRVDRTLAESLSSIDALLDNPGTGEELAAAIRAVADPLGRLVNEAAVSSEDLRLFSEDEEDVAPLLDELLRAAASLTDRYAIPTSTQIHGEWRLPTKVNTVDVPFRELAIAYIESSVSNRLHEVSQDISSKVDRLAALLSELERVVAFNVELAGAELDVLRGEKIPDETRNIVRDMVVGALRRSQARIKDMLLESASWGQEGRDKVRVAVLGDLESFRSQVVGGRVTELRLRLLRDAAAGGRLAREASQITNLLSQLRDGIGQLARTAVGTERLDQARRTLGLPISDAAREPHPSTFAPPGNPDVLPVVYRRLFSDQAMEAGDLLTGRKGVITSAVRALTGADGGRYHAAAIVGVPGVGKGAVINAIIRDLSGRRVVRLSPTGPVTVAEVDEWFSQVQPNDVVVVDGMRWLFETRAGGFAPLKHFVSGVVNRSQESAWLVAAVGTVWDYASQVVPLDDAFPEVIRLTPLSATDLSSALLARHAMSGYTLRVEAQDDLGWQLHDLLSKQADHEDRHLEAWFRTLHSATGGVIHDALAFWMASVTAVDEHSGTVRIGPVPRPPIAALRNLPDDVMLTLRQLLRLGWITPDIHADLFRRERAFSAAHLARLAHFGLVSLSDGRYEITSHLVTPVHQVLTERGWMT